MKFKKGDHIIWRDTKGTEGVMGFIEDVDVYRYKVLWTPPSRSNNGWIYKTLIDELSVIDKELMRSKVLGELLK